MATTQKNITMANILFRTSAVKIAAMLAVAGFLTGCIDGLDLHPDKLKIVSPKASVKLLRDDVEPGATEVVLSYASTPKNSLIYFNGQKVEHCFTFEEKQATSDLACMSEFFKQGENLLSVDPLKLGPVRKFTIDSEGPLVIVYEVQNSNGNATVSGKLRDASSVSSLYLNGAEAVLSGKKFTVVTVTESANGMYEFIATDVNGYAASQRYLPSGSEIDPILDMRVDESFIGAVLPVLEKAVSGMEAPEGTEFLSKLDKMDVTMMGVVKGVITVKSLFLQNMRFDDISINDKGQFVLDIFAYPRKYSDDYESPDYQDYPRDESISIHDTDEVEDERELGIKVGVLMTVLGIDIDMVMMIETMDINAAVDFEMVDGNLTVVVDNSGSGSALNMHDIRVPKAEVDLPWWLLFGITIDMGPIIEGMLASGALDGMVLDIVQSVIDENMKTLSFPFQFNKQFNENATADLGFVLTPKSASTNAGAGDDIGNMLMNYRGVFEASESVANVPEVLGSYYVGGDALPPVTDEGDGSALVVSVNASMVNQLMLALYESGLMHFTVFSGKTDEVHLPLKNGKAAPVFFGLGTTDNWGEKNDMRVVLNPRTPPQFKMKGDTTTQATLSYYGAAMSVDKRSCSGGTCVWKSQFSLDIDIEAGVLMQVSENNTFEMTIDRIPSYEINNLNSSLRPPFNILVNDKLVSFALDQILKVAIPQITETAMSIDAADFCKLMDKDFKEGDFCWSAGLTTQSVSSQGGHLSFKMGVTQPSH